MTIEFACPSCSTRYQVKDELAGRTAQCRKCGKDIKIQATAPEDDDLGLQLAEPAAEEKETEAVAESGETCPVCNASLVLGTDMCMACGTELKSDSPDEPDSEPKPAVFDEKGLPMRKEMTQQEKEQHEVDLRKPFGETIVSRLIRWTITLVLLASALIMGGYGVQWIMDMVEKSSAANRIGELVVSIRADKHAMDSASKQLAVDIEYLPAYLTDLSKKVEQAKKGNLNITGLWFEKSDNGIEFQLARGKQRPIGFRNPMAKGAPKAWLDAAAISTLILHLPENSNFRPLMRVHDEIGMIAAVQLFNLRKDLKWELELSCDKEEVIRQFAARLLLKHIRTDVNNEDAFTSLSKRTKVADKYEIYDKLQKRFGAVEEK
ncbi:MAG: hypothetical protein N2C12_16560 [Planctomycetales bacterium]